MPLKDPSHEQILFETRISWWALSGSFVTATVLVTAAAAVAMSSHPLGLASAAVLVLLGLVVGSRPLLNRASLHAKVTSRRIVVSRGIVRIETSSINLSRIEAIDVEQGLVQRLLGYGNVVVHGMGDTPIKLCDVDQPTAFRDHAFQATDRSATAAL